MIVKMLVQNALYLAALGALLMVPAGRIEWPQAWAFLAVLGVSGLTVGFGLARTDPDLLRERMTLPTSRQQRPWDRAYFLVLVVGCLAWFVAMGVEARFTPPAWGLAGQTLGAVLIAACMWVAWLTFRENSFATPDVRIQAERGQHVISTGPYALVRHPLYAGAALWMLGTPLLLGSRWGLLGGVLMIVLVAIRALGEEKVLVEGLPGYEDYRRKVRFRLLPGVW
jgi:protein-S-isoprenylcysteine O-methyltransferase Ste14